MNILFEYEFDALWKPKNQKTKMQNDKYFQLTGGNGNRPC